MTLETITLTHGNDPDTLVIWLHGLGADGHDFEDIVPLLQLPQDKSVEFIFPNAPIQAVTINAGMKMRSWFDITDLDFSKKQTYAGLQESIAEIKLLIEQHENKQIILAGFSQGALVALLTGLQNPKNIIGILALSTFLPEEFLPEKTSELPIMMMHGEQDPLLPFSIGQKAYSSLKDAGFNIEFKSYPMQHAVCMEEAQDIGRYFLKLTANLN